MSKPKQNTAIEDRLLKSAVQLHRQPATSQDAAYMHSVLTQVFMPLRNPKDARSWERKQGRITLALQSMEVIYPKTGKLHFIGLPYGPKARLILSHINTQAILTQSPVIDVAESVTAFTNQLGLAKSGRNIHAMKDQLARLASTMMTFGYSDGTFSRQLDTKPIQEFELWFEKGRDQKVIWPTMLRLSEEYFQSLLKHAVPLDIRALSALSHNARALDMYSWLAQRLYKIPKGKFVFISWQALIAQFAPGYDYKNGKRYLIHALRLVKTQYNQARFEQVNGGVRFYSSTPPILGRRKIICPEVPDLNP